MIMASRMGKKLRRKKNFVLRALFPRKKKKENTSLTLLKKRRKLFLLF